MTLRLQLLAALLVAGLIGCQQPAAESPDAADAGGAATADAAAPATLAEALTLASEKSAPLMIIGTAHGCGSCEVLKKRLKEDADIQDLVAQFVQLVVYVDEDDQLNPVKETFGLNDADVGAPMLYVGSADGDEIAATIGNPPGDELPEFLEMALARAKQPRQAAP